MPVLRLNTRGVDQPGDVLTAAIDELEGKGCQIVSLLPLQEEWLIVFSKKPKRETRHESRG